jgi:hypothetical protein
MEALARASGAAGPSRGAAAPAAGARGAAARPAAGGGAGRRAAAAAPRPRATKTPYPPLSRDIPTDAPTDVLYDAVIVGGGMGGLTTAAKLVEKGAKVRAGGGRRAARRLRCAAWRAPRAPHWAAPGAAQRLARRMARPCATHPFP